MISEKIWRGLLVALVVLGCSLALAPIAFGEDAGPPEATSGPPAAALPGAPDAGPTPGTAAVGAETKPPLDPNVPPTDSALWGDAQRLVVAVRAGRWREVAALALMLSFGVLIRFGRKIPLVRDAWTNEGSEAAPKWVLSDGWGTVLAFVVAGVGALGTSLLGSEPIDFTMFRTAFWIALGAVGMHRLWKQALKPALALVWAKVGG